MAAASMTTWHTSLKVVLQVLSMHDNLARLALRCISPRCGRAVEHLPGFVADPPRDGDPALTHRVRQVLVEMLDHALVLAVAPHATWLHPDVSHAQERLGRLVSALFFDIDIDPCSVLSRGPR